MAWFDKLWLRPAPHDSLLHDRWDWAILVLLSVGFALVFQLGVPLRASFGARITGDEPFYLLTTESLRADGDLDLTNDYARQSYARFYDGDGPLWYQSAPRPDGVLLSPHNIGLSVLLLPAYAVGGVDGAKAFLGVLGGIAVGWTYLLNRRVTGGRTPSVIAAALLGASAPWFIYATQIYPELPAALLVTVLVWVLLAGNLGVRHGVAAALALAGLMWLGSKYAPVVAIIAVLALARLSGVGRLLLIGFSIPLALHYIWFHLATYDGLTPYSVNRLYAGSDTVELLRVHWELPNRLYRLLGLWVDREFGLARWSPILFLALPGAWLLIRQRSQPGLVLAAVLVVQMVVAAFLTVTMRGWWFPGRMLVVVLPLLAPFLVGWLAYLRPRWLAWTVAGVLAAGTLDATWNVWQAVRSGSATLAVNPFTAGGLWLDFTASWFPLFTAYGWDTIVVSAVWILFMGGIVVWLQRSQRAASHIPVGPQPARLSP